MKCADPICKAKATRELLGISMCDEYFIEALEHSAHIVASAYLAERIEECRDDRLRRERQAAAWALRNEKQAAWMTAYRAKKKAAK